MTKQDKKQKYFDELDSVIQKLGRKPDAIEQAIIDRARYILENVPRIPSDIFVYYRGFKLIKKRNRNEYEERYKRMSQCEINYECAPIREEPISVLINADGVSIEVLTDTYDEQEATQIVKELTKVWSK